MTSAEANATIASNAADIAALEAKLTQEQQTIQTDRENYISALKTGEQVMNATTFVSQEISYEQNFTTGTRQLFGT